MAAGSNNAAILALQVQVDALGERMDKGIDEIKRMLEAFDGRVRAVETREAGCQPILTGRMDAAWRTIDDHEVRIRTVEGLMPALRELIEIKPKLFLVATVGGFVGTAVGGLVIAFLFYAVFGGVP